MTSGNKKTALLFPGQGAQSEGMGKSLYDTYPSAKTIFHRASDHLHRDIAKICFEGSLDELSRTENLQPALFTLSAAALELMRENEIMPSAVAGFSLGEISALYGCGILSFEDTLDLVSVRSALMQRECERSSGAMYAILGLADDVIEQVCTETSGYVVPVNYNCPGQLVIAGEEQAAAVAAQKLLDAGAAKTVKLNVSGAFHCTIMSGAADDLRSFAAGLTYNSPNVPLYLNVTGEALGGCDLQSYMPDYIARQMVSPVRFAQQIRAILDAGVDKFVELGAGRTLSGFVKRITRDAGICNVEDVKSFENAIK